MPVFNNIMAGASAQSSGDLGEEIAQSLRFQGDSRLVGPDTMPTGNYTFAFWIKRSDDPFGTSLDTILMFGPNQCFQLAEPERGTGGIIVRNGGGVQEMMGTTMPDYSAWYHICWTVTSNTVTTYVNGVKQTQTTTQPSGSSVMTIGSNSNSSQDDGLRAYLAEVNLLDGTVIGDTNGILNEFGRVNEHGVWVPKKVTGLTSSQYGDRGFRLQFNDSSNLGDDSAPTGTGHTAANDFTEGGTIDKAAISSSNPLSDVNYLDTPTRNFATFNPVFREGNVSVGDLDGGNLISGSGNNTTGVTLGKKIPGKDIYFEIDNGYGASTFNWGQWWNSILLHNGQRYTNWGTNPAAAVGNGFQFDIAANVYANNVSETQTISSSSNANTIYGVKITDTQITLTKDGNSTNVTNMNFANNFDKGMYIYAKTAATNSNETQRVNFGQQAFLHEPSGVTKLEVNELPEPSIKDGREHFKCHLYDGGGSDNHAITGVGFQPDLVWIKPRDLGDNHRLIDSVTGVDSHIIPNSAAAASPTDVLHSFDSDGFTLEGTDHGWNSSTIDYVAWCWKCGDSWSSTDANITAGTLASSGKRNLKAGMSIVSYTGNTSQDQTVSHGLDKAPEMMLVKNRSDSANWIIYHAGMATPNNQYLMLHEADGAQGAGGDHGAWDNTAPTSTVFSVGNNFNNTNGSGDDMVAYCWYSVDGYSQFGSYLGNGHTTNGRGPFVYLGFKPAFLMIKADVIGDWVMLDTARHPGNVNDLGFKANNVNVESADANYSVDFLSNGFKIRNNADADLNADGDRYMYMAFAEHPFGGKNVPPATGR